MFKVWAVSCGVWVEVLTEVQRAGLDCWHWLWPKWSVCWLSALNQFWLKAAADLWLHTVKLTDYWWNLMWKIKGSGGEKLWAKGRERERERERESALFSCHIIHECSNPYSQRTSSCTERVPWTSKSLTSVSPSRYRRVKKWRHWSEQPNMSVSYTPLHRNKTLPIST